MEYGLRHTCSVVAVTLEVSDAAPLGCSVQIDAHWYDVTEMGPLGEQLAVQ